MILRVINYVSINEIKRIIKTIRPPSKKSSNDCIANLLFKKLANTVIICMIRIAK